MIGLEIGEGSVQSLGCLGDQKHIVGKNHSVLMTGGRQSSCYSSFNCNIEHLLPSNAHNAAMTGWYLLITFVDNHMCSVFGYFLLQM